MMTKYEVPMIDGEIDLDELSIMVREVSRDDTVEFLKALHDFAIEKAAATADAFAGSVYFGDESVFDISPAIRALKETDNEREQMSEEKPFITYDIEGVISDIEAGQANDVCIDTLRRVQDFIRAQAKEIKDLKWSIDSKDREIRKLRVLLNENTTD